MATNIYTNYLNLSLPQTLERQFDSYETQYRKELRLYVYSLQ